MALAEVVTLKSLLLYALSCNVPTAAGSFSPFHLHRRENVSLLKAAAWVCNLGPSVHRPWQRSAVQDCLDHCIRVCWVLPHVRYLCSTGLFTEPCKVGTVSYRGRHWGMARRRSSSQWLHCSIAFWAHKLLAARDYLFPSNYFIVILDI